MTTRTNIIIAAVIAAALILIVATIQIIGEGVDFRDGSISPQKNTAERDDPLEFPRPTSAIEDPTLNTSSQTNIDSASSFAGFPDSGVLRWPASEYEAVFGLSEPSSPLQKVHTEFVNEPRDASWADAMESGISQALIQSDATSEITVAYVECRSTICEVAGFMPDRMQNPELDPYNLFPEEFGAGWWQGRIDMAIGTHTYEAEGLTRFIVIIAEPDAFLSASDGY